MNFNLSEKRELKKDIAIKEIADHLSDEIVLAHKASDGYIRNFDLPYTVLSYNYQISINGNSIYIITNDEKHAASYSILNVTGQPYANQTNNIRKIDGAVYLN